MKSVVSGEVRGLSGVDQGPLEWSVDGRTKQQEGGRGGLELLPLNMPVRRPFLRTVWPTGPAELGTLRHTLLGGSEFQWESISA